MEAVDLMDVEYRQAALRFLTGLRYQEADSPSPPSHRSPQPRPTATWPWRHLPLGKGLERFYLCLPHGHHGEALESFVPLHLCCITAYHRQAPQVPPEVPFLALSPRQRTISYASQLRDHRQQQQRKAEEMEEEEEEEESGGEEEYAMPDMAYDPYDLDDPELRQGKHKTVFALEGHLGMIGPYTRAADLRRNLNEQFRQLHPQLPASLTLTQIRRVKALILEAGLELNLELSTVAKAYVLLEKLILAGLVHKANRRLVGACCLLLAAKANDSRAMRVDQLMTALSQLFQQPRALLMSAEWEIFVTLHFHLILPNREYLPHLDRLLSHLNYATVQEYVGERMYHQWKRDTHRE